MAKVWQAQIEFHLSDDGKDLTAKVSSRSGSSGECPMVDIHADTHFMDDALRCLGKTARQMKNKAMNERWHTATGSKG